MWTAASARWEPRRKTTGRQNSLHMLCSVIKSSYCSVLVLLFCLLPFELRLVSLSLPVMFWLACVQKAFH